MTRWRKEENLLVIDLEEDFEDTSNEHPKNEESSAKLIQFISHSALNTYNSKSDKSGNTTMEELDRQLEATLGYNKEPIKQQSIVSAASSSFSHHGAQLFKPAFKPSNSVTAVDFSKSENLGFESSRTNDLNSSLEFKTSAISASGQRPPTAYPSDLQNSLLSRTYSKRSIFHTTAHSVVGSSNCTNNHEPSSEKSKGLKSMESNSFDFC